MPPLRKKKKKKARPKGQIPKSGELLVKVPPSSAEKQTPRERTYDPEWREHLRETDDDEGSSLDLFLAAQKRGLAQKQAETDKPPQSNPKPEVDSEPASEPEPETEEYDANGANSRRVAKDITRLKEEGATLREALDDSAEQGGGPRVFAPIRRIAKNGDRAIILSQILFWFGVGARGGKIRARIRKRGKLWVAKFAKEWEQELGIPVQQVYRHFEWLKDEAGLIETITAKMSGQNCLHVRPNFAAIMESICKIYDKEEK